MGHFSLKSAEIPWRYARSLVPRLKLGMQMVNSAAEANEVIFDILLIPIVSFGAKSPEEHQRVQDLCHWLFILK